MNSHASRSAAVLAAFVALACLALLATATPASADPVWNVSSEHGPTNFAPGGTGQYIVRVRNVGDATQTGTLTVTDTLPAGVLATEVTSMDVGAQGPWTCDGVATSTVTCTREDSDPIPPADGIAPGDGFYGFAPAIVITVSVPATLGTFSNEVLVSGGGGGDVSTTDPTTISTTAAGFGLLPGSLLVNAFDAPRPDGAVEQQAGAHPFELRVDFAQTLTYSDDATGRYTTPVGDPRILETKLPVGFIGNPQAAETCTDQQLRTRLCPIASQVGVVDLILNNGSASANPNGVPWHIPVYNMERAGDFVAELGFVLGPVPVSIVVTLDPVDHSIVATILRTTQTFQLRRAQMTLWGVPADPAHDVLRADYFTNYPSGVFGAPSPDLANPRPFLTMPSQCTTLEGARITMDSWGNPGVFVSETGPAWTIQGCRDPRMRFEPALTLRPEERTPSTPTGLDVTVSVPQKDDTRATSASQLYASSGRDMAIATPPMRNISVTLPEGMTVSPSSANGLAACSPAQIDLTSNDDPACPAASKIGDVTIDTPLLAGPLTGSVYFATQNDNPFNTMLALYIVAQGHGVTLKLPGKIAPDAVTGQLTATFDDNPQFPFSTLRMHLKGGPRAPLVTPPLCGVKTTNATITSWNGELPGVQATDRFVISADGNGGACGPRGFNPSFTAGTKSPVAGADSPLVTRFSRSDADEELAGVEIGLPPGVLGRIADVSLCSEANAAAGTCGEASRIGTAVVGAGPGSDPFFITDGRVYITEPYKGAPFGLSIVVHAKAGPIDLGNVNVRAQIQVDRTTAALTVVTEPLPTILAGIPLLLRVVDVTVDRPGFTFNPTNCSALQSSATLRSTGGQSVTKTSRFQATGCGSLKFRPRMTMRVGRTGHTRRGQRTPLVTVLRMPRGDANLASVKVVLPTTINALLPVIQRACTPEQFRSGNCRTAEAGVATAVTPLLDAPLRGGAYFVDNGRPLPDLMIALRGQVDVDLTGKVTIPDNKRLATNFGLVPDVPISKFTLRLSDGRNGPLGIARNLCTSSSRRQKVSLLFRAQNGDVVRTAKRLQVKGCAKPGKAKARRRG